MKKKEIKTKLFKLLETKTGNITRKDWEFIDKHLTYEIINEYIDTTGRAVLIPGLTDEIRHQFRINELLEALEINNK
jgi:hypothetical protein